MRTKATWALIALAGGGSLALADWDPGDGHIMHHPQTPSLNGWSMDFTGSDSNFADDWRASTTGAVSGIHFWYGYRNDLVAPIESIHVAILSDDPGGPFPRPADLLWERDFLADDAVLREYDTGNQSFHQVHPLSNDIEDHSQIFQANLDNIVDPFMQSAGETYWLSITVTLDDPTGDAIAGWTTAATLPFGGNMTWSEDLMSGGQWKTIPDPFTEVALDMSFVLTPSPSGLSLLALAGLAITRRRR